MDDRRGAEGVEHLQAAARELLGAARAFLDVVEDVVEDSDRLSGAAASIGDLLRTGLGSVRQQPWEQAAWDDRGDGDDGDGFGRERPASWWDEDGTAEPDETHEPEEPDEPEPPVPPAKKAAAKKTPAKRAPASKAPAKQASAKQAPAKRAAAKTAPKDASSRVRRISVD